MTTGRGTTRCDKQAPAAKSKDLLDLVRELLAEGRSDEVVDLVAKLLANQSALKRQLAELSRKRFKSSEVVSSAQLRLLLADLAEAETHAENIAKADAELKETASLDELSATPPAEPKPPKRPKRRAFPKSLRRIEKVHPVPDDERACPSCNKERGHIGYEETEVLDIIPAEVIVRVDKREKLRCKDCDGHVARAPLPDKVIRQGVFGARLVACVLVDKYHDGLPLHRQIRRFRKLGISLPLSTLIDQVKHSGNSLDILREAAIEEALESHVMHLDGTGLPVLNKRHRNGKRLGALWGYVGDGKVSVYLYASTGKKRGQVDGEIGPEDFLDRRKGLVVADASNLFDASFKRDDLIECGCNAHGRRGFVKALDGGDSRAALPIGAYRRLYMIEREGKDLSTEERTKLRQQKSRPVFDAILRWCQLYASHEPPSSPLGKAIQYFINHHEALGRFIDDGSIPIDNSLIERQHVRVALTRKNFLFSGSDAGGHRAAVIYTLLGSCELNQIDPVEYLADVLPRVARRKLSVEEARELLPHRWKAARADR